RRGQFLDSLGEGSQGGEQAGKRLKHGASPSGEGLRVYRLERRQAAVTARASVSAVPTSGETPGRGSGTRYTLRGQDWHIFKLLKLMDEQGGGVMLVNGGHLVETIVDGPLELLEGIKPGGVQGLLADEAPQAFDQVEVG